MTNHISKVVIVYQTTPPLAEYLSDAFRAQGIEAIKFNVDTNSWFDRWVIHLINKQLHNFRLLKKSKSLFESHPLAHRQYVNSELAALLKKEQPDLIVTIRGPIYAIKAIKASGIPSVAWWVEPANRVQQIIDEASVHRWVFSMNWESVDSLKSAGYDHASYLSHAVSTKDFHPIPGVKKRFDVCFVGGWTEKRQRVIDAVLKVTKTVAVYGPGWLKKHPANLRNKDVFKGASIYGVALNQLYNESRIGLNITQWDAGAKSASGMNMRFLEIPATGTLLLTDYVVELNEVFDVGREVAVYETDDLEHQLKALLSDSVEREAIASAGLLKVSQGFTYASIVSKICQAASPTIALK